jgi:type IV secretory pathway TrbL component
MNIFVDLANLDVLTVQMNTFVTHV